MPALAGPQVCLAGHGVSSISQVEGVAGRASEPVCGSMPARSAPCHLIGWIGM